MCCNPVLDRPQKVNSRELKKIDKSMQLFIILVGNIKNTTKVLVNMKAVSNQNFRVSQYTVLQI